MQTSSPPSATEAAAAIRRRILEAEARRRGLIIPGSSLTEYDYDAGRYIREKLGWIPWEGSEEFGPGQAEVIRAYELALRQLHERKAYEAGELEEHQLRSWRPAEPIKNRLRIEAGHTVGKTKLSSGLVNHFFDCFAPSIIYTFAPSWKQIHDLLWKEIKTDRRGKGLPGKILDLRLEISDNHFATGSATSDAGGRGTERIQGQHNPYLMFVLDEAEGIPDFVWGAVDSMASGGICIVLMLANPRTRSSKFHKQKSLSTVENFRISCLQHPNVLQGREVVPGAVQRGYVETMVEKHCEVVSAHDPDEHTFTLPFPVRIDAKELAPGTILKPNAEFLFRVLGVAPANIADNTLIPVGRYEAACRRDEPEGDRTLARMGVDVARWGKDFGTLYIRRGGRVWRAAQFWKQDSLEYCARIREAARGLAADGVKSLHVRVDGGGGFGSGVIDLLKSDAELKKLFADFQVLEVHFNGTPHDKAAYYDLATELYGQAAEALKGIRIANPPETLEADLCERLYKWVNREGVSVKRLEPKDDFKKPTRIGRSPDDGDGLVLATAPDFVFHRSWAQDPGALQWLANRYAPKPDPEDED